jgi:hypothetical protein
VKTDDLDATIASLNSMLESAESTKDKLAITDRLLKCYGLRYKHAEKGTGAKFSELPPSTDS